MAYMSTCRLRGYTKKNKGVLTLPQRDPSCLLAMVSLLQPIPRRHR